ncbi:spore protease YyaC [Pullulanibacillus camelliae]|uniref:Spore protease YyaC n=1 Tax=Pullulanibacillus camelliae TaxID=1707096 RepID=A0A8J2YJM9_9BACL|nr:spore protease YyaC [Pullulanibacillus camelliae]GGE48288.1 spore protease YyaC [Pullulanibacillus camelliae]
MNLKRPFNLVKKSTEFCISYNDPFSRTKLTRSIESFIRDVPVTRQIVIVCIGTDRSTGDSLGPLVGRYLNRFSHQPYAIYGTIDAPVHAMNLSETIELIYTKYNHPFVIAVDACLGKYENIGNITLDKGAIKPGAGVKKKLPEIGDIHIKGIVNVSGYMEYLVLQNTRLSLVMNISEVIGSSLHNALINHFIRQTATKVSINQMELNPNPLVDS